MLQNQIMLSVLSTLAAVFLGLGFFGFLEDGSAIHPLLGNKDFATVLIAVGALLMVFELRLLFRVIKAKRAEREQGKA